MKATGIVRRVDDLGRVVLPISVRRDLSIDPKDDVEMFVDGENIVLQKYVPGCVFCGEHEGLSKFKGKIVCRSCMEDLSPTVRHETR